MSSYRNFSTRSKESISKRDESRTFRILHTSSVGLGYPVHRVRVVDLKFIVLKRSYLRPFSRRCAVFVQAGPEKSENNGG